MSAEPQDDLAKLIQRMDELKKEAQRIDLELKALQAEGDARAIERTDSKAGNGNLFDTAPEEPERAE